MRKSWHLSRRTFLRSTGVALGLPILEAMLPDFKTECIAQGRERPRRLACIYVPNGVNNAAWIPRTTDANFTLGPTHEPLRDLRNDYSIVSGIGHPGVEPGHAGGDTFLTGAVLNATAGYDYKNSISLDQVAAGHFAPLTRFPSLELSREGGTGSARATHTMSFSREGVPLSTENRPRSVFERLFLEGSASSRAAARQRIQDDQSILDILQDDVRSLNRRLGPTDRMKVDEYLSSVRAVEKQVRRTEEWMNVPRPSVDATNLRLEVNPGSPDDLRDYLRTMFDLIFLAFQMDTTRVCTFQMHREVTNQQFNAFLGFPDRYHGLSHHGGDREALDKLARIDRFHIEQLAYFLAKLKAAREGDGSLLDRTLVLYGSGMNNGDTGGHYATNIPILFAGGHGLGVRQGQHLAYRQSRDDRLRPAAPPLANLFRTMLRHLGIRVASFAGSTGEIAEFSA